MIFLQMFKIKTILITKKKLYWKLLKNNINIIKIIINSKMIIIIYKLFQNRLN